MDQTLDRPNKNSPLTPVPHEVRVAAGKKSAARNLARDPDFYKKLGAKGGSAYHKVRGFQGMTTEQVRAAGAKGGRRSRKVREES